MKRFVVVVVALAVLAVCVAASFPHVWGSGEATTALGPDGGGSSASDGTQEGQLDPALSRAVTKAQTAAAAEGVEVTITSGWRSAEQQQALHEEAIEKYGSVEIARQWVLPPNESEHVRGGAVDIGPTSGAAWLEANGVRFGICRVYENEPWHFELLAPALGQDCPALRPHA